MYEKNKTVNAKTTKELYVKRRWKARASKQEKISNLI